MIGTHLFAEIYQLELLFAEIYELHYFVFINHLVLLALKCPHIRTIIKTSVRRQDINSRPHWYKLNSLVRAQLLLIFEVTNFCGET